MILIKQKVERAAPLKITKSRTPDFPKGKFGTIVADPPWSFANSSRSWSAASHYRTMDAFELTKLPVGKLAAEQAHLYLWTTDSHLALALELTARWGFNYKQNLVWVKGRVADGVLRPQIGLGNWYRHSHELLLFATKGDKYNGDKCIPSVLLAPRKKHSQKPDELLEWAERMSPGPRIELFARQERKGWQSWGNEV